VSATFIDRPDQWPPDSRACVFLARIAVRFSKEELWAALCSGELTARIYCVGRKDFAPIPLSPLAFVQAERDQVLADCQIWVRETDTRRPAAIRRIIAVPHWLYVTRESLEKFEKARPGATTAAEGRVAKVLADHFRRNPKMTRSEAAELCSNYNFGPRAFDRVWSGGRSLAELPAHGSAGRPRKSLRKSPQ
jgi:hypothetical protein